MKLIPLKRAKEHGGGTVWVNPVYVVSVNQHDDDVVNLVPIYGAYMRVTGSAHEIVTALTRWTKT